MSEKATTILIVEDGDEYLENLRAFLPGPTYLQAHAARGALEILASRPVDLVFLDMRFDRTPRDQLLGSTEELLDGFVLTEQEAWSFIEKNQGLYIYRALRAAGHRRVPVLLSYDFSLEQPRWRSIAEADTHVHWIPDAATPASLEQKISTISVKTI